MTRLRWIGTAALALLLAACSHTLYVGELETPDAYGVDRVTQVYWYRTDPAGGDPKAGPIVLRTACATPIQFDEASDGIVFRGDPGRDRLVGLASEPVPAVRCGRVETRRRLVDLGPGELRVSLFCEPVDNEFSVVPRNYPRAASDPYLFPVTAERRFGLAGKLPEPPAPPACTE